MQQQIMSFLLSLLLLLSGCSDGQGSQAPEETVPPTGQEEAIDAMGQTTLSGAIPAELEYVPDGYTQPAGHPGTLEKLEYQTWESFSYEKKTQRLTKTAWVYLPYGYDETKQYNILYLSHGGWSNETGIMGTPDSPHAFKHIIDHAIEDGMIHPLIIVLPTYNNTSPSDSGDYIDNGPEDIMSTGFWKGVRDGALTFAEQYNTDGGNATVIDLPKIGITGNSHFMFQELNNAVIADHIEAWIQANVK